MAYSTEEQVRAATGMLDDTLITDAFVETRIDAADDIINGKIGDVYSIPLSETPDLIEYLSIELASGLLYLHQYGEEVEGTGLDGQKKIDGAIAILDLIQSQKLKLFDSSNDEFARSNLSKPVYYPTQTSTDDEDTPPLFKIDQQF